MLAATSADDIAATVFIDIALILVAARLAGRVARRLGQPAVVGEIIAGIALGPSLLGALPGDLSTTLFPADVRPFLQVVAQIGLVIFMFIVGLELDLGLIRGKARTAAAISISSIVVPFGLGFPLAAVLHRNHGVVDGSTVDFLPFALFIGASMSVTAFPVLARILNERGMLRTPVGALTLACAAVDDVMAWSLLAVVLAVVASTGAWDLPVILLESAVFVAFMFLAVKPFLRRFVGERYQSTGTIGPEIMAIVLVGLLASSYATAKIGIHQIFGAFLFGAVIPRDTKGKLLSGILERLETVAVLLLLPVFFVITGLGADVRGLGAAGAGELALILLTACAGKFIGAMVGARTQGIRGRQAMTIGTLMNTRGLTELVILNVGLTFGVLDRELFTMLVVMAVVTTVMAEPILRVVYPRSLAAADVAASERSAVGDAGPRVLVSVGDPVHAARMVDLAADLLGDAAGREVVLTRFSPWRPSGELGSGTVAEREQVASWMSDLHQLAEHAQGRGVRPVVLYQFSDDVAADLVAQAASVGASLMLVGAPRPEDERGVAALDRFTRETGGDYEQFLRRVLADSPCEVGVLVHPVGTAAGTGVALVGHGPNSAAATGVAERVAAARRADIMRVTGLPAADGDRVLRDAALVVTGAQAVEDGADAGRFGASVDAVVQRTPAAVLVVSTPAGQAAARPAPAAAAPS